MRSTWIGSGPIALRESCCQSIPITGILLQTLLRTYLCMFGIGVSLDSSGLQKRDGDNGMEGLYRLLPVPVQNLACTLYGFRERRVRLSRFFWDRYEWLLQTEGASTDEIRAYQDEQ